MADRNNLDPTRFPELLAKLETELMSIRNGSGDGERSGTAAGHQRSQSAVLTEESLIKLQDRVFVQRGSLQRVVEQISRRLKIPLLQRMNQGFRPTRLPV
ncbi:hypothetical protein SDC9_194869 [bioreactor metagenome]|uniref:Uncharacterized protein n=1 Tax=bioreactor metagenome TaxID=1076179 RepID=A0A645I7F3_9ZZZZ